MPLESEFFRNLLEAAALVFFALLVLFDTLAHLSTDNKKKTLLEKVGLCESLASHPSAQNAEEWGTPRLYLV